MPDITDVRVAENGRLILPLAVRQAMGLRGEGRLILTLEGDEVRLTPVRHGVRRAQALYRQHATAARTMEEFLADRAEEAAREEERPRGGEDGATASNAADAPDADDR